MLQTPVTDPEYLNIARQMNEIKMLSKKTNKEISFSIRELKSITPMTPEIQNKILRLKRFLISRIISENKPENKPRTFLKPNDKGYMTPYKIKPTTFKDELRKDNYMIREKWGIKSKFRSMKRDLLENSAKICMNPRRIMRLLEEDVISLDNIDTLYHL
jgi:hypothetical protein